MHREYSEERLRKRKACSDKAHRLGRPRKQCIVMPDEGKFSRCAGAGGAERRTLIYVVWCGILNCKGTGVGCRSSET